MKNSLKVPLISAMFATMPLNSNAEFSNHRNDYENGINTSLFENLSNDSVVLIGNKENINLVKVNPKIIVDAVLNYFDEDVKMFKFLSCESLSLKDLK